jgi:hypothetical protein
MLIYTVATDGAHPDEITREIGSMLEGNPVHMTTFIRVVTRNIARLVKEQFKPTAEDCHEFLCCANESYCSPVLHNVDLSIGEDRFMIFSRCFSKPFPIGPYLFTGKNGVHWFSSKSPTGGMFGLRFTPLNTNPYWFSDFERYAEFQRNAAFSSAGPKVLNVWHCEGRSGDGKKVYNVSCMEVDLVLEPVSHYMLAYVPVRFYLESGQKMGLTLHRLIENEAVYASKANPHNFYFLDLDFASKGPTTAKTEEEYKALHIKFPFIF